MRKEIKVSIIVPVYNVERYLRECLNSLCHQTLKEIEIICVNDGSTDNSQKILQEYSSNDSRICIIDKANTGYGHTMNVGIENAAGEYVGILESDDFAETDMFEKLYDVAKRDRLDVVKANYYNYYNRKDHVNERLACFRYGEIISCESDPEIISLTDSIWSALYRRKFILENNITFHETPGASYQDTSFACQVWMFANRVEFMEDRLLHYRMDNTESSIHAPGKVFCICDEWRRVEEIMEFFPEKKALLKSHQVAVKYAGYLYNYRRLSACYQYALLVQIEKELKRDSDSGYLKEECFDKDIWQIIQSILAEKDDFFRKTSKEIQDERLELCDFLNKDIYYDAFLKKIRTFSQVIIYGAGKIGKCLADRFMENDISIFCFAVTDRSINPTHYRGVKIEEFESIEYADTECVVIIAVGEKDQYEIYKKLNALGVSNIVNVDRFINQKVS